MSMMSDELMSSACEVDVCGVIGMHALRLASGTPSALLDWNNNYGDDPDKAVCFHCSNLPKHFFAGRRAMDYQAIIAGTVGRDNTYGTLRRPREGRADDLRALLDRRPRAAGSAATSAKGAFTDDPLRHLRRRRRRRTSPQMQELLRFICENGFEHHVAANLSSVAAVVHEATTKYLGWEVYRHR